eukprot:Clim_evm22s33 gene=Clim_evmTU22s33
MPSWVQLGRSQNEGYGEFEGAHESDRDSIPETTRSSPELNAPKKYTTARLAVVNLCWIGILVMWSNEYALAVPYFESRLGLSKAMANLAWCAGPITGLIVGPIAGALSDRCYSSWGRRRPFMLIGLITTLLGAAMFSNAELIAGGVNGFTVFVAMVAFWTMDFSINLIQGPARALIADLASPDQQAQCQSLASLFQGVGQVGGYFFVASFEAPLDHMRLIFAVAMFTLAVTVGITLVVAQEVPLQRSTAVAPEGSSSLKTGASGVTAVFAAIKMATYDMVHALQTMDYPLLIIAVTQSLTWFAWFCFNQEVTTFFGEAVYGGDAEAPVGSEERQNFEHGVGTGSISMMGQAIVQLLTSFAMTYVLIYVKLKDAYTMTLVTAGLSMLLLTVPFVHSSVSVSIILVSLTGIGFAGTNIFPFAMLGNLLKMEEVADSLRNVNGPYSQLSKDTATDVSGQDIAQTLLRHEEGNSGHDEEEEMESRTRNNGYAPESNHSQPSHEGRGSQHRPSKGMGFSMGLLNVFIVIPQLIDTLYVGSIAAAFGIAAVILVGGIWSLLAALSSRFLPLILNGETGTKEPAWLCRLSSALNFSLWQAEHYDELLSDRHARREDDEDEL